MFFTSALLSIAHIFPQMLLNENLRTLFADKVRRVNLLLFTYTNLTRVEYKSIPVILKMFCELKSFF